MRLYSAGYGGRTGRIMLGICEMLVETVREAQEDHSLQSYISVVFLINQELIKSPVEVKNMMGCKFELY